MNRGGGVKRTRETPLFFDLLCPAFHFLLSVAAIYFIKLVDSSLNDEEERKRRRGKSLLPACHPSGSSSSSSSSLLLLNHAINHTDGKEKKSQLIFCLKMDPINCHSEDGDVIDPRSDHNSALSHEPQQLFQFPLNTSGRRR